MIETSVVEHIAESVERELARVRAARPGLASRVERAGDIITTHLSCRRQRVIRVRIRDVRPRFLVNGSGGAVYVVDPAGWGCSCPDAHRRGKGCKHALACWALWRASARPAGDGSPSEDLEHVEEVVGYAIPPAGRPCASCGDRFAGRELVDVGDDHLTFFEGDDLCRGCAAAHGVL